MLRPNPDQGVDFLPSGNSNSAPRISVLLGCPNRRIFALLTIGYFTYLWLIDGMMGSIAPFVVTFAYFFLTHPRWKALKLEAAFGLYGICVLFYLFDLYKSGPRGIPLLLQFAVLAPAVFLCVAPVGPSMQWARYLVRMGRSAFILLAIPYFIAAASLYWPDLNRTLSQIWSLLWSHADSVQAILAMNLAVVLVVCTSSRAEDIGASRWLGLGPALVLLLRFVCDWSDTLSGYVPLLDATLAASFLILCLWPGRESPPEEPTAG
jgi:hypothetical protein